MKKLLYKNGLNTYITLQNKNNSGLYINGICGSFIETYEDLIIDKWEDKLTKTNKNIYLSQREFLESLDLII